MKLTLVPKSGIHLTSYEKYPIKKYLNVEYQASRLITPDERVAAVGSAFRVQRGSTGRAPGRDKHG